ncbi:MAG: gamma-glutamylcyclotransferase [Gammaproteobacteria bacterium]|nr:gamma-glutamylcyclotransferase [Gammaproteobacteria bacterium]
MVARYFAYGSNMNVDRMRERGMNVESAVDGRAHGLKLQFQKASRQHAGAGHANVAYAPGSIVEGVLYTLSSSEEISRMDPFELAPVNYSREVVQIATAQGVVSSWIYFANPAVLQPGLKPPRSYLDHLLAGKPFLSASYYQMLQSWECFEEL